MFRTNYQVVSGLWNPAAQKHSWITCQDFDTIKEARAYVDELIAEGSGLRWGEKLTNEHREKYDGPPLAILEVRSRVMERIGGPELEEHVSREDAA